MVLNEKRTTVAYRCPDCGGGVLSAVGLFNLSADMVKLKCTCGKSELKIVYNRDGTVRLTVPCLICSQPHSFTVNSSLFFSDELFVLPCPYSDINIAFTGEMNTVKAELARTELELLDMLEENGITDFSALHGDEKDLPDPQILDIILFVIDDLDAEGKIYCRCHPDPQGGGHPDPAEEHTATADDGEWNEEGSRYEAEITEEGIKLTCRKCGASTVIPTDSMLSAHAFLNADSVHLQ
jgi:hypothetical protein